MTTTPPSLADLRRGLHVSYSQIRCYTLCPAKYLATYITGVEPSHRPVAMVFGGAVHVALAAFYGHAMTKGEKMPLEGLQAAFRDRWESEMDQPVPIAFDDVKDAGAIVDQGVAMLRVFHEKAEIPTVVAVEQAFSVDLVDPVTGEVLDLKLVGAFDLVTNGAGRPVIWEHKTAARKYTREQLAWDIQPSVYAYAAREAGIGEVGLKYQILLKTRTPGIEICNVERTPAHVREMLITVTTVLRSIEHDVFFRNRGWACADCPFAYRCGERS
jgi:putative RecB family exonuclease